MNQDLEYIELTFHTELKIPETTEIVIALLQQENFTGFWETEQELKAYIPYKDLDDSKLEDIRKKLEPIDNGKISWKKIENSDWTKDWREHYYAPVILDEELLVRASFHQDYPATKYEIIIDPKMAFGTGNHATTYMLLREMLQHDLKNKNVLDMGAGTGILSILARKKGAQKVLAVDNDPHAITNIKENISVNKTSDIEILMGDINVLDSQKFDLIIENIWKNTVLQDLPRLAEAVCDGGMIWVSGFYHKECAEVRKAGEQVGLQFIKTEEKEDWGIVCFQKKKKEINDLYLDIYRQIRVSENGVASEIMQRSGLPYAYNYGVNIGQLKEICEKYKNNDAFADFLLEKKTREMQLAALMIYNPENITPEKSLQIARKLNVPELQQQSVNQLFVNSPKALQIAEVLIHTSEPYSQSIGWILCARLAKQKEISDSFFDTMLQKSKTYLSHSDYQVIKALARALREIALRNEKLKKKVLEIAEPLKNSPDTHQRLIYEESIALLKYINN